jgi:hypothetical protein
LTNIWGYHELKESLWYLWRLNGSAVFISRRGNTWNCAVQAKTQATLDGVCDGPIQVDGPGDLLPFTIIGPQKPLALRPTMVGKPIVLEVENTILISQDQEINLDLELPVSFHFEFPDGEILCFLNTFLLHTTWFGDYASGRLCFSFPYLVRSFYADNSEPHLGHYDSLVSCRVVIRNLSKSILELKRFIIYTEMLGIWEIDGNLCTQMVVLEGMSDELLRMGIISDSQVRKSHKLADASVGQTELLVKRGVNFLRSITMDL